MLTTRHAVDFAHTHQEFDTLFRYANAPDVEHGGRYDACSAAVNIRSDHWTHPATAAGLGRRAAWRCAARGSSTVTPTDRSPTALYRELNQHYFGGRLPRYRVTFA